jgi:hypothetical protein
MSELGHSRHFRPYPAMSALTPITTKPATRHDSRKGPLTTKVRRSKVTRHSITSSASASRFGGISTPRALAVLRLMISSKLDGCSTGKSAGHEARHLNSVLMSVQASRNAELALQLKLPAIYTDRRT